MRPISNQSDSASRFMKTQRRFKAKHRGRDEGRRQHASNPRRVRFTWP